MFSGGLDSVAMAILLKRQRLKIIPVYMSHRAGGNVTKKELVVAGQLAQEICGRELEIFKKRPATRGSDAWYSEWGNVNYTPYLPVPKKTKGRRNRVFLKVASKAGLTGPEGLEFIALGVFGPSANPNVPKGDVCYDALVRSTRSLEPGQLITFESLGITDKTQMLKAVGKRSKKNCEYLWASESCLMYFNKPCGNCISCVERATAFMNAWGRDKTPYRRGTTADRLKRKKVSR
jgi:7-cyano-7-deazaguanine synthase in queuosine biosynthesis